MKGVVKTPRDVVQSISFPESSVYLHGTAARDPFTSDAIKQKQPDCYNWLVKEFGQK